MGRAIQKKTRIECPVCDDMPFDSFLDLARHIYIVHYRERTLLGSDVFKFRVCWCGEVVPVGIFLEGIIPRRDVPRLIANHLEQVGVENLKDHFLLARMGMMHVTAD